MGTKILGIDIGSFQVRAIIAEQTEENLKIIGIGTEKAQGIKKGTISNIEQASKSIKNALANAQRVAGTHYEKAIVSISGAYTKSVDSTGVVNVPGHEIGIKEIDRVMQMADHNANIPADYERLHVLPYSFKVDEQEHVEDPLGMNANRLEVQTHIIIVQKSYLSNLRKAVNMAGIKIDNIVLSGYASAIATLNQDEKDLGVALIDMGGSTCNVVIHSGNSIKYNDFLPVGSSHITSDLSIVLHTPVAKAEEIKVNYGSLLKKPTDLIELPVLGDESKSNGVSLDIISNVIYSRVEETLMFLHEMISSKKDLIGAGVVLTGGMTKLEDIREAASAIFSNMQVRIAKPKETDGLFEIMRDPSNSCAIGLCMYGAGEFTPYEIDSEKRMRYRGETISKPKVEFKNVFDENIESISSVNNLREDIGQGQTAYSEQEIKSELSDINIRKENTPNFLVRFWNWLTHLF
ncbi:cell division protein FtsA [Campylobacter mucosalis]|uniref:cell division protein FtsA n=1 Tax=Campylobacter mucosalis TaxID=202 RepID=UPI0014702B05|nr:cell division protein FtsA [Campylobacter mucosalis]